jgi:radical SAM superfamily enzyme YgiQ (UPF0313 family)
MKSTLIKIKGGLIMINQKKVCCIVPPSPFLLDERVFMSLGLLKVAAVIEQFFQVDFLDLSGVSNFNSVVEEYLSSNQPLAICLTVTTPQLPHVFEIVKTIREKSPDLKIIIGGPHVTLTHSAFLRELKNGELGRANKAFEKLTLLADVLIAGDGEKAILEALKPDAPKVVSADDPKSNLFLQVDELDFVPWPDRDLVDVNSYKYFIDGERALSIVTQLGCPFGCGFCGGRNSPSFRRKRSRSIPSVVAEMESLYLKYGIKGFMFYDDELNVDHHFFIDLMSGIIELQKKHGLEFRLRGFIKSQLFNEEQAEYMYKVGFRWILTGFESASPKMLTNMKKMATVEQNTRCVEIGKKYNLKVKALMSVGHPGESRETIKQTKDWLIKVKPDDFDITVITVYPGTPYYDEAKLHDAENKVYVYKHPGGDVLYSKDIDYATTADFYKGDPNGGYESYVFTEYLSPKDIVTLRNDTEAEVRKTLGIPYPSSAHAIKYEHSMGQFGVLKSSKI